MKPLYGPTSPKSPVSEEPTEPPTHWYNPKGHNPASPGRTKHGVSSVSVVGIVIMISGIYIISEHLDPEACYLGYWLASVFKVSTHHLGYQFGAGSWFQKRAVSNFHLGYGALWGVLITTGHVHTQGFYYKGSENNF